MRQHYVRFVSITRVIIQTPTTRTIEWNVTDVSADSSQAQSLASAGTSSVTIVAVNDAPVLTGGGNTIPFSEGDPAVVLDNAIALTDSEGSAVTTVTVQLAGATGVTITNSEVLEFDATASTKVTGTLSNNNRTLTITRRRCHIMLRTVISGVTENS